jgi:hypothetical protein
MVQDQGMLCIFMDLCAENGCRVEKKVDIEMDGERNNWTSRRETKSEQETDDET